MREHGLYATMEWDGDSNLVITLTAKGKEEAAAYRGVDLFSAHGYRFDWSHLHYWIEDILCNSEWEIISPDETGDLWGDSDGMLTCTATRDEDGTLTDIDVAYFDNMYAYRFAAEALMHDGYLVLTHHNYKEVPDEAAV